MKSFEITANDFATSEPFAFGSMRWRAVAVEENGIGKVYFYDSWHLDRIVEVENVKPGDYLWCHAAGKYTTAGKCSLPSDQRLRYLWKQGFRKSTKSATPNVVEQVYNEEGGDWYDGNEVGYTDGRWAITGMRRAEIKLGDKVLFSAIWGRVQGTNNTNMRWYMDKDAKLSDIILALENATTVDPICLAVPMTC